MANPAENEPVRMMTPEQARSRRARNLALCLTIGGLVVLFYAVTLVKLGMRIGSM
jgi:hypothetical protein